MQVIVHDRPILEPTRLAIAFAQFFFDERRDVSPAKPALAVAAIQPSLDLASALRIIRLVENALPLAAAGDGKGVMQHEGDELRDVRCVKAGKITALVPAEEGAAA